MACSSFSRPVFVRCTCLCTAVLFVVGGQAALWRGIVPRSHYLANHADLVICNTILCNSVSPLKEKAEIAIDSGGLVRLCTKHMQSHSTFTFQPFASNERLGRQRPTTAISFSVARPALSSLLDDVVLFLVVVILADTPSFSATAASCPTRAAQCAHHATPAAACGRSFQPRYQTTETCRQTNPRLTVPATHYTAQPGRLTARAGPRHNVSRVSHSHNQLGKDYQTALSPLSHSDCYACSSFCTTVSVVRLLHTM